MSGAMAFWRMIVAFWNTGNRLIRVVLAMVILWPLVIAAAGLTGRDAILWAAVGLLPVLLIVLTLGFRYPMVLAVFVSFQKVQGLLGEIILKLLVIFGIEMTFGILLFWLRPAERPQVFLILCLIIVAIIALVIGARWWTGKTIAKTAVVVLTIIGLLLVGVMYFGWDSGLKGGAKKEETKSAPRETKVAISELQEFSIPKGVEMPTVIDEDGWLYRIWANHPYVIVAYGPDRKRREFSMAPLQNGCGPAFSTGFWCGYKGASPGGLLPRD